MEADVATFFDRVSFEEIPCCDVEYERCELTINIVGDSITISITIKVQSFFQWGMAAYMRRRTHWQHVKAEKTIRPRLSRGGASAFVQGISEEYTPD